MNEFDTTRAMGEPDRYEYLSREQSALYDKYADGEDEASRVIVALLGVIQRYSRAKHMASPR